MMKNGWPDDETTDMYLTISFPGVILWPDINKLLNLTEKIILHCLIIMVFP